MIELVVLGMHRSGTSAMAGLLSRTGFGVGASLLLPNQYNPRGYFENKLLVDENNALLERLHSAWDDVRPLSLDALAQHLTSSDNRVRYKALLETALSEPGGVDQGYVLKDPRLCRVLPLWQPIWQDLGWNPRYILMLRHPDEVVASLQHRDGMAPEHGYLLYVAYLLDAERYTRTCQRSVVLYDRLLHTPETVWHQLTTEIQLPSVVSDVWTQAVELLTPELRHHQAGGPAGSTPGRPETPSLGQDLAYRLWAVMQRMEAQPSAQNSNMLEQLHADFLHYVNSIAPWLQQRNDLEELKKDIVFGGDMYRKIMQSNAVIQLFWGEDVESFNEEKSVRLPLEFSKKFQDFCFFISEGNIGAVRLDLSDRPFFCEISKFEIFDEHQNRIWAWNKNIQPLFFENPTLHFFCPDRELCNFHVLSLNKDPQAILRIPTDVLLEIRSGWCFKLSALIDIPSAGLSSIINILYHYIQEIDKLNARLNRIKNPLPDNLLKISSHLDFELNNLYKISKNYSLEKENKIKLQKKEIEVLRIREQKMHEQLLRAEAQLDLLKTLCQGKNFL